ncbi:MAG: SPOR domain-containing protein [Planctomycetota bacterium]
MNEQTRFRITGAIFLFALAVIFLPMLFDGSGVRIKDIPVADPVEASARAPAPEALEIEPTLEERYDAAIDATASRVDADGFDTRTGTRIGEPDLAAVPRAATLERVAEVDSSRAEAAAETDDRLAPPAASAADIAAEDIWAVQLASFSRAGNAKAFRDRLIGDGFEAWLSTVKRNDLVRTRVAVGPVASRKEAERLRAVVSQRYDVDAILVTLSP